MNLPELGLMVELELAEAERERARRRRRKQAPARRPAVATRRRLAAALLTLAQRLDPAVRETAIGNRSVAGAVQL